MNRFSALRIQSGHVTAAFGFSTSRTPVQQNEAAMGIFITLEEHSKSTSAVAAQAGVYHSDWDDRDYPRIQILSLADPLERHREPELPPAGRDPYQKAQHIIEAPGKQKLFQS